MDSELIKQLSDYFTTTELVELLDVDTEGLIMALQDHGDYFDDDTLADLKEIMGMKSDD